MLNIRLGMHKSKGCNKSKIDLKENHFLIKKKHTSKYDRFKNKPTVFCSSLWSVRVCLWKYAALKLCWPCDLHWLEYIVEIMLGKFQSLGLLRPYGFHIWLPWDIVLKLTCKGASPIYCGFRDHQWFGMEGRKEATTAVTVSVQLEWGQLRYPRPALPLADCSHMDKSQHVQ